MPDPNCEDCKGTGLIETESVTLSRPYYSKDMQCLVNDVMGHGDWKETQCHCID